MSRQPKLSTRDRKLLDAFDRAAQSHGWQADQGVGPGVQEAADLHAELRAKMERRLAKPLVRRAPSSPSPAAPTEP